MGSDVADDSEEEAPAADGRLYKCMKLIFGTGVEKQHARTGRHAKDDDGDGVQEEDPEVVKLNQIRETNSQLRSELNELEREASAFGLLGDMPRGAPMRYVRSC